MADSTRRILVADGDAATRKDVGGVLRANGVEGVVFAVDPKSMVAALKSGSFAAALVDWNIATFNEFILLKKIRAHRVLEKLPVVIMYAGDKSNRSLAEARLAGASGFLRKPCSSETLTKTVRAAMNGTAGAAQKSADASPEAANQAMKLFRAGYAQLRAGKVDQAMAAFAKAAEADADLPEAWHGQARAMQARGEADQAKEYLGKAAEAYAYKERESEAEALYNKLRTDDPETANPFKNAANRMRDSGDVHRAVKVYEKAFELSPDDDEVASKLSQSYIDTGDEEKAEAFLRELLGTGDFPSAAETFLALTGDDFYATADADAEPEMQILDEEGRPVDAGGGEQRGAKRFQVADYSARERKTKEMLSVVDMSITGIGFKPMGSKFKEGKVVLFDLIALGSVKIKKMEAKVMRVTPKVVGCQYINLSKKQQKVLDQMFK